MLEVEKAEYAGDYAIRLSFNNGRSGIADLEQTILNDHREVFFKLRDKENFKKFKVEHSTVTWSDELDLAAEYLFYIAFKNDSSMQEQFKAWGYIA